MRRKHLPLLTAATGLLLCTAACRRPAEGGGDTPAAGGKDAGVDPKVLYFGLTRAQGADAYAEQAAELGQYLSRQLRRKVVPFVTVDYAALAQAFRRGEVELAWMPPLEVARASDAGGRVVLQAARDSQTSYRAALLVKKDGGISAATDLRGRAVAWVDRGSAAGYLYPREWLLQQGLGTGVLAERFVGSHRAACEALAAGEVAAAATFLRSRPGTAPSVADSGCAEALGARAAELTVLTALGPIAADGSPAAQLPGR